MPPALETVDFALAAAAATGFQQFGNGTNQTGVIRGTQNAASAHLIDVSAFCTTQADVTIRSPRLHDVSEGILMATRGGEAETLFPLGASQGLFGQDSLVVGANFNVAPAASAIQHVVLQVYYEDLGGSAAQLRHWSEVQPSITTMPRSFRSCTDGSGSRHTRT